MENWLGDENTEYEIGGRATDVSQLAVILEQQIKLAFPINRVPDSVLESLRYCERLCKEAEIAIHDLIETVDTAIQQSKRSLDYKGDTGNDEQTTQSSHSRHRCHHYRGTFSP